jgi:hypothetical protein
MRTFKRSVVLAVGLIGMCAGSARAQERLVSNTPFPFDVHGIALPAGRYNLVDDQGLITIRGDDRSNLAATALALATPSSGHDPKGTEPSLVFIHADGRYRLSRIWESARTGLALDARADRRRHAVAELPASEPPTVVPAEHLK